MENPQGLRKFQITDREECGLIIKNGDAVYTTYIVRVPNHAIKDDDYVIHMGDVKKVFEVLSDEETIIGFFHTHLKQHSCQPSDADLDGAELFPGMNNLIYKPNTHETQWYGVVKEVAALT